MTKAIEISVDIRELANELKKDYEVDTSKGRITLKDVEDKAVAWLKEEDGEEALTLDDIKKVQGRLIDITAAQTLALGEISQEVMKDNPELTRTSTKTKLGYSQMETSFTRKMEGTTNGTKWEKYGKANTNFVIGTGRKATPYRDVLKHLEETSVEIFAD